MSQMRLWTAALIIAIVVIGGFFLSVPRAREVLEPGSAHQVVTASSTPPVTIHDTYKKGTHTITGSVTAPDACMSVSAVASLPPGASSTTPQILIDLTLPADSGMCLEVPTAMRFSVSVAAPAGTPIEVRVNGDVASTTGS